MNISFFLLILVLFALAFLTSWNKHVLLLLGVTTLLWGAMMWYVLPFVLTLLFCYPSFSPHSTLALLPLRAVV